MSPPKKFESGRWSFISYLPTEGRMTVVEIEGGSWFPLNLTVQGRYKNGPLLTLVFEVIDRRPVFKSLTVSAETFGPVTELSASGIHDLPIGQIIAETIARTATGTLAFERKSDADIAGQSYQPLTADEIESVRRSAVTSLRGRPVDDETLRRVGRILATNTFDFRAEVRRQLHVSDRTASRYIAQARSRKYDQEARENG